MADSITRLTDIITALLKQFSKEFKEIAGKKLYQEEREKIKLLFYDKTLTPQDIIKMNTKMYSLIDEFYEKRILVSQNRMSKFSFTSECFDYFNYHLIFLGFHSLLKELSGFTLSSSRIFFIFGVIIGAMQRNSDPLLIPYIKKLNDAMQYYFY